MRKIKSFRLIGFIIALAIIFSSLSVFGSTVAFAAEDSTSYSGEEFVESKEFSNAANGETLQSAFSNKTDRITPIYQSLRTISASIKAHQFISCP